MTPPFARYAPPASLPLRHFALAAAGYLAFSLAVLLGAQRLVGFGFDAKFALGAVHCLTLFWIACSIFGAWCQMLAVHGERPLDNPGLAAAGSWLLGGGGALFIGLLWSGSDRYWLGASAAFLGVCCYLGSLGATLARTGRRDWAADHFAAAFVWLALLALVGVLMAFDRQRGTIFRDPEGGLIAHVHMALLGFAGTTVLGAGYRLFPWVAMHRVKSQFEGRACLALWLAGLTGLSLDALFFGRVLIPLWAALLAVAFLFYLSQFRSIFTGGATLEPSLGFVLLGLAGATACAATGVGLSLGLFSDVTAARKTYVFLALAGAFVPLILSQAHRVAPFIVWLHAYGLRPPTPGEAIPTIDRLLSRGLAWGAFFFLAPAVPLGAAGLGLESAALLRAAGVFLTGSAACYALNLARALSHLRRRPRPAGA